MKLAHVPILPARALLPFGPGSRGCTGPTADPSSHWQGVGAHLTQRGPGSLGQPRGQSLSYSWTRVHCQHTQPQLLKEIKQNEAKQHVPPKDEGTGTPSGAPWWSSADKSISCRKATTTPDSGGSGGDGSCFAGWRRAGIP